MLQQIKIKRQHYAIEELASGSLAHIYRAVNVSDSADVRVVKVIKENYLANEIVQERFLAEFKVLNLLKDQQKYFAQEPINGKVNGQPFLSYGYVEGETVLTRLKQWSAQVHSPLVCCALIEQILSALVVLHTHITPIVHSDLSPENIIVGSDGVYLIDMGCAQPLDEANPNASRWVGKPSYLSPEQARGEVWSTQSDIFQAGIVFYELLTGQRWNRGSNAQEKKVFASNPANTNFTPLPIEVRPVLRSMLKTERSARIATATLCLTRLQFARNTLEKKLFQ